MSFNVILSICDNQPLRGFIPDHVESTSMRMTPAIGNRIWSSDRSSDTLNTQEIVQHLIHGVDEPQPSLNAWYLTHIENSKKVLDGILKVKALYIVPLTIDEAACSKTLHYLHANKYITQKESDDYHAAFGVHQYALVTVSLGITDNWIDNIAGIFFSIVSNPPEKNPRLVSVYGDIIHKHVRHLIPANAPGTYMTCDDKEAHMAIQHAKLFLNALLKAEWTEYRPFSSSELCLIDKESFAKTLCNLQERKLLTVEEVAEYTRQFFNK